MNTRLPYTHAILHTLCWLVLYGIRLPILAATASVHAENIFIAKKFPDERKEPGSMVESHKDIIEYKKLLSQESELKKYKKLVFSYSYDALERSIENLKNRFGDQYPDGNQYLAELEKMRSVIPDPAEFIAKAGYEDLPQLKRMADFRLNALVYNNPLIDFDSIIAVRRFGKTGAYKLPADRPFNWAGLNSLKDAGKNAMGEIVSIPIKRNCAGIEKKLLYRNDRWVGRLDLHFDADKVLFSTIKGIPGEARKNWNIYELSLKDNSVRNITAELPEDTDSFDSCYLQDEKVIFVNTSGYQGVPCVGGKDYVGNLHVLDPVAENVRRLTFEQDNNWHPCLLPNGRLLYLRWEYTDSAHYYSRVLMHMNPDGTDQKEYYGANSYWPNCLFYAKPIPGKSGMFAGIVCGHHGVKRAGELVLFDINKGRVETAGAVQKIPGYGKPVPNITKDELVKNLETPYFLEPYPLSEQYLLAASDLKTGLKNANLVLCDIYDNVIPLTASDHYIYGEPIPFKKRRRPPRIPERIKPGSKTAVAYIADIYHGRGMKGIPRGTVDALRIYSYEYSPRNMGGHYATGMEAGWDVRVMRGIVPVNTDGSVVFEIPANTPISLQPIDKDGRALSLMRSWMTAMPGEFVSCIGCHESQQEAPPLRVTQASKQAPVKPTPWQGKVRSFSFLKEVQPVLDRYCIGCHDGRNKNVPDFATTARAAGAPAPGSVSYFSLHPFIRRNGPEGDYRGLTPGEFYANTSELIQILKKGHHGVKLDKKSWERLYTWIDLNACYLGDWVKKSGSGEARIERRYELLDKYAGIKLDYAIFKDEDYVRTEEFLSPEKAVKPAAVPTVKGFPFDAKRAKEKQGASSGMKLDLGDGVIMKLRRIPEGSYPMGSNAETPAERPVSIVGVDKPFWLGETEVTLKQFRQFMKDYKNGVYDMHWKDQVAPGYDMDEPEFPVIRVSWKQAMAFCDWLSGKSGRKVTLPTEAQWEWAARAGTIDPAYFGKPSSDFSGYANLADLKMKELAVTGVDPKPIENPNKYMDYVPHSRKFNDKALHLAKAGSFKPNPFGLYDMIGNVAEWTISEYKPYPYTENKSIRMDHDISRKRTIRGGSWHDRPKFATSATRWGYPEWQRVYNVGFRVSVED